MVYRVFSCVSSTALRSVNSPRVNVSGRRCILRYSCPSMQPSGRSDVMLCSRSMGRPILEHEHCRNTKSISFIHLLYSFYNMLETIHPQTVCTVTKADVRGRSFDVKARWITLDRLHRLPSARPRFVRQVAVNDRSGRSNSVVVYEYKISQFF